MSDRERLGRVCALADAAAPAAVAEIVPGGTPAVPEAQPPTAELVLIEAADSPAAATTTPGPRRTTRPRSRREEPRRALDVGRGQRVAALAAHAA